MKAAEPPTREIGLARMRDLRRRVDLSWKVTAYQYQDDDDALENITHMRPFHLAVSEAVAFVKGYEGGRHD